ncbi:MAG TPA: oligosaccharide flippase family protein [Gemmatimonadaceae bacterium]|nr:oligosaccharide flippase family protein [Gemmatimonadaceae bacterium]
MTTIPLPPAASKPHHRSPLVILRNAGWLTIGRLIGDGVSFGLFIVLSRYFGPAGIGQFAYGFAIASFAAIFVSIGLDEFGVREFARGAAREPARLLGKLLASQFALMVLVAAGLATFLVLTHASSSDVGIVLLLSAQQALLAVARTFFIPAYAVQAMARPALMEVGCRVAGMLVTLVLVIAFHASLVLSLVGYPIGAVALLVMATSAGIRQVGVPRMRTSWNEIARMLRVAWPFGASDLVFLLYTRADLVILTWLRGDAMAGIYATALKFFEVSVLPLFFLGFAAYPALSQSFQQRESTLPAAAGRLVLAFLTISSLIAWGLIFIVPSVLVPLLGDQFVSAAPVTRLMAVLVVLTALEAALTRLLLAIHLQVIKFKLQVVATVLNIALDLLLIPTLGIPGAIAATAIALAVVDVLYIRAARTRLPGAPLTEVLTVFLVPLVCAVLAGTVTVWLGWAEWLVACTSLAIFLGVAWVSGLAARLRHGMSGQPIHVAPDES